MKRFYSKFRISLMTFALGLASFWMFDGFSNGLVEVPVNLPKVQTDSVIFIIPKKSICLEVGIVYGPPFYTQEFIKEWRLNCLSKTQVRIK